MSKLTITTITLLICLSVSGWCSTIVYVDSKAPGPMHDGTAWERPFKTITEAVKSTGEEVWVRTGVYSENIVLDRSVNLYGGFLGGESSIDQRIPGAFPTVVDARREGRGIEIVRRNEAIIDGFTIRNGLADVGGGILVNTNAVGHIRNCRIEHCEATSSPGGGGVYYAKYAGAMDGSDWGEIRDSVIGHNRAPNGGGVVVEYHAYANLVRCVITSNHATESGGGVHLPFHSGADLINCTVAYNTAELNGGAAYIHYGGPHTISNCIIAFNSAPTGGGLFGGPPNRRLTLTYTNCNLYENSGGDRGGTVRDPSAYPDNISSDPLFIAPQLEEYRLKPNSPCDGMGAFPLEPAYRIDRIETASKLSDGDTVILTGKVITRVEEEMVYVKEIDGSVELRIAGLTGCSPGDILANVTGALSTGEDGERVLHASSHRLHSGFSHTMVKTPTEE